MTDRMDNDSAFAPLDDTELTAADFSVVGQPPPEAPAFRAIMPAALPPPGTLPGWKRHRRLVDTWIYPDAAGDPLCLVVRFDVVNPDGTPVLGSDGKPKKETPALVCGEWSDGTTEWRWMHPPEPRPVYGLDRLAARPDAPVLLVEGEKAADAAQIRFPDHVAVTWQGGSNNVSKADLSVFAGRVVTN